MNLLIKPLSAFPAIISVKSAKERHCKKYLKKSKIAIAKAGKKCFIPFLIGNESNSLIDYFKDENSESQEITKAILSSAKCKILIDKSVLPVIDSAYFEGRGGQNYSIALFDYGVSYCLEIPFIVLFETGMYNFDRIVVIRG